MRSAGRRRKPGDIGIKLRQVEVLLGQSMSVAQAEISDVRHRMPRGMRPSFAINAEASGLPLHMLQKWMCHAQLSTTRAYVDAVENKEQDIAAGIWR